MNKLNISNQGFRILSLTVILFECLFPLVLILPKEFVLAFITMGFLFHLGTAIIMGLNSFWFSFVCFYPAVIFFTQSDWPF